MVKPDKLCKLCKTQIGKPGFTRLIIHLRWLVQGTPFCPLCQIILDASPYLNRQKWVWKQFKSRNFQTPLLVERWLDIPEDLTHISLFSHGEAVGVPRAGKTFGVCKKKILRKRIDVSQIRSWIDNCETTHKGSCVDFRPSDLGSDPTVQFIFIDVQDRRLIESDLNTAYFALSYVWGGVSPLSTTKANRASLGLHGSLHQDRDDIPQVIKDAMELVAALGERYLWVDALCICQDDFETKHQQLAQMGNIYAGAVCTLVALAGQNATMPLPGFGADRQMEWDNAVELAPNLYVKQRRSLGYEMDRSVYDRRAWTFQERILSKRCLYFGPTQVVFECRSLQEEEDTLNAARNPDWPAASNLDNEIGPVFEGKPLNIITFRQMYGHIVEVYSAKKLSYISDVENAFVGIGRVLESAYDTKMVYGIPEAVLDIALLWTAKPGSLERRGSGRDRFRFPSWSWMGWIGPVDCRAFAYQMASRGTRHLDYSSNFRSCISQFRIGGLHKERLLSGRKLQLDSTIVANAPEDADTGDSHAASHTASAPGSPAADHQNIALQFWAYSATFSLHQDTSLEDDDDDDRRAMISAKLEILDSNQRCCGVVVFEEKQKNSASDGGEPPTSHDFILLSRILDHDFISRITLKRPNIYLGFSDEDHYEYEPWDILCVLAVRRVGADSGGDHACVERVGIGHVHRRAWQAAGPRLENVCLV